MRQKLLLVTAESVGHQVDLICFNGNNRGLDIKPVLLALITIYR